MVHNFLVQLSMNQLLQVPGACVLGGGLCSKSQLELDIRNVIGIPISRPIFSIIKPNSNNSRLPGYISSWPLMWVFFDKSDVGRHPPPLSLQINVL